MIDDAAIFCYLSVASVIYYTPFYKFEEHTELLARICAYADSLPWKAVAPGIRTGALTISLPKRVDVRRKQSDYQ